MTKGLECVVCGIVFDWEDEGYVKPFGKISVRREGEISLGICPHCTLPEDPAELVGWVKAYNIMGCCGHIVFDDYNIEDRSIDLCLNEFLRPDHQLCKAALEALKRVPENLRKEAMLK